MAFLNLLTDVSETFALFLLVSLILIYKVNLISINFTYSYHSKNNKSILIFYQHILSSYYLQKNNKWLLS